MLDSLVRVSRRAESLHFVKVPNGKSYLQAQSLNNSAGIASYPSRLSNKYPQDFKARCRHLSPNHDY